MEEENIKKEQGEKKTKTKILLVDDDFFLLDMYSLKFKNAGYDVHAVPDAEKALDVIRNDGDKIDIILSDIIMPGIRGWDFVKTLRDEKLAPDATIIILSNQGQQSDFDKTAKFNVDGYIVKALATPSEVVHKVEEIYQKKISEKEK